MCPSGRLHDNSLQIHSIELKFCAQNCLINISVEFEDEKDPSRNGWVIEKIVIIDQTIPEGGTGIFFLKNFFLRIIHNIYKSTQFLTLIPNLILVLNQIELSKRTSPEKGLEIQKNCIPRLNCLDMSQLTCSVGVSQIPGSVAI